ncbi:MAG: RNA-binding protein [Streptosporangiaceae bacterium]|nr:RNA-binding protein [Streptosporangiaceae bacterium]
MGKFNTAQTRPQVFSPVAGEQTPSGKTFEGGPGFARDTKSELFLYAVSRFSGEGSFYEDAKTGDTRYRNLIHKATAEDPSWVAEFLRWLRADANMRSAAIVGAAEYTKALALADTPLHERTAPTGRKVINSVILRADEPGEMIAYWTSQYGMSIPWPVKRGVADAMLRLGTEMNYLKWDSEGRGYTFDRLLNLTHPGDRKRSNQRIRGGWQGDLFGHIIKAKYEPATEIPESLQTLTRRQALMKLPVNERRAALEPWRLAEAGMTWEALAGWLQGPMDAQAWEAIIPNMGYMALIRNLRNFDQAGVSDEVAMKVAAKLADPEEVAKSRQLPMRFLSAYRAVPSDRWKWPLTMAVNLALRNIPTLGGRTLILVDTSTSMHAPMSDKSGLARQDAAALFGCALATRCERADLVSFSSSQYYYNDPAGTRTRVYPLRAGESLLAMVDRWNREGFFLGGGTQTEASLREHYAHHDRVVILTDEQADGNDQVGATIPATPIYTWNLAGYTHGHAPSGSFNRHVFGGLQDSAFKMVPMIESGVNGRWPWQVSAA